MLFHDYPDYFFVNILATVVSYSAFFWAGALIAIAATLQGKFGQHNDCAASCVNGTHHNKWETTYLAMHTYQRRFSRLFTKPGHRRTGGNCCCCCRGGVPLRPFLALQVPD